MTGQEKIRGLLEAYLRHLPMQEKTDFLTRFGDSGKFERLDKEDIRLHVFGELLERLTFSLDPKTAQNIAHSLLPELRQKYQMRKSARKATARLPKSRAEKYRNSLTFSDFLHILDEYKPHRE
jgi:hypothetical protein